MTTSNAAKNRWRQVFPNQELTAKLEGFGGILRCTVCGEEEPLGSFRDKMNRGWPMCHGYTMRWLTQRELDAEKSAGIEVYRSK